MDTSTTPTASRTKRNLIAVGLLVLGVLVTTYATPRFLTGSLLPEEIAFAIKDRADTDDNGTLSAREIRRTLIQIVRQVALGTPGYDTNDDGSINRTDVQDSITAFRSLLTAVCGNSQVDAGERCDDGDTDSGDGCSATCSIESNFTCTGAPSACTRRPCDAACANANILAVIDVNNDGVVTMQEFWDLYQQVVYLRSQQEYLAAADVNADGTVSAHDLVSLQMFRSTPGRQICGEGNVTGNEACDDGDNTNGDGCSMTCTIENTYRCTGSPSICTNMPACNATCVQTNMVTAVDQNQDGVVTTTEINTVIAAINSNTTYTLTLDINRDGAVNANDAGLLTTFRDTTSNEVCGNARVNMYEYCDDGNNNNGDGCSSVCVTEAPPGSETQMLHSIHLTCENDISYATVTYSKDYVSCTHLRRPDGTYPENMQNFCEMPGSNIVAKLDMPQRLDLTSGERVKLCHPMILEPWACSPYVTVTGTKCDPPPVCGNGIPEEGEECDDGNTDGADACMASCVFNVCGDGYTNPGVEQCDDGNQVDTDFCSNSCVASLCSNGTIDPGEQCDDGNQYAYDTCTNQCRTNVCGDGVVRAYYEQCDDGNTTNFDGCNTQCQTQVCGNNLREWPEGCDDPTYPGCNQTTCVFCGETLCGNGAVESNIYTREECDDRNSVNTDSCSNICMFNPPRCGNGVVQTGEQCDDNNTVNGDGCSSTCQTQPVAVICGNGVSQLGEVCDHGAQNIPHGTLTAFYGCTTQCSLSQENMCGNGVREGSEICDDGNYFENDGCTPGCRLPSQCGNGIINAGEICDNGAQNVPHGTTQPGLCTDYCGRSGRDVCGNGVAESPVGGVPEECDDDNTIDTDLCRNSCQFQPVINNVCGNNILEFTEQCDDGNTTNGDNCSSTCRDEGTAPTCGNGIPNTGEQCDDGNQSNTDSCTNICRDARCGDSAVLAGIETCDDGNTTNGDGCSSMCQTEGSTGPVCGDSFLQPGEQCDDSNTANGDGCSSTCQNEVNPATCGNGVLNTGGQCDDDNNNNGDGCSSTCQNEVGGPACGNGVTSPGEQCDDNNQNNTDACTNSCQDARCGDGFVRAGTEQCDDGNTTNGDTCNSTCTEITTPVPGCGNGLYDEGEECDDGDTDDTDFCTNACRESVCGDGVRRTWETCDDGNTNNGDFCSDSCNVITTPPADAELIVSSTFVNNSYHAVANEDILLHRVKLTANPPSGTTHITVRRLEFRDDWGDVTDGFGTVRLLVDTDDDGIGDEQIATATVANEVMTFSSQIAVHPNEPKILDVRVTAGPYRVSHQLGFPMPAGPQHPLMVGFNEGTSTYVRATYGNTSTQLMNVSLDGSCPTAPAAPCRIAVFRTGNIINFFDTAANLRVTGNVMDPPPETVILAGGESQTLLDFTLYVSGYENVLLNQMAFHMLTGYSAIDSLSVYVNGEHVGDAQIGECANIVYAGSVSPTPIQYHLEQQKYCLIIDDEPVLRERSYNHVEVRANVKQVSQEWQFGTPVRFSLLTDGHFRTTGETSGYTLTQQTDASDGGNISFSGYFVTNTHTAE